MRRERIVDLRVLAPWLLPRRRPKAPWRMVEEEFRRGRDRRVRVSLAEVEALARYGEEEAA